MKQCFGYVRVSTQKQGEGISLMAQKEAIQLFAARNKITITKWFEEKETAAKKGRPIFNGMIRALRKRAADGVVIHKIDRSARNIADWAKIGELSDTGIDVYFATETLDFRSRGGRLSADIQAVIAADYIRNLREETLKGINGRLKQGIYPFGAPIGYLNHGGGKPKTPDPAKAPFIKEAFQLYASGQHSLRSLQAEMTRRGLRSGGGKPLTKRGIETLLSNPFYCGVIRMRKTGTVYQGVHQPIISASLFEAVQNVRAGKCGKKVTKHNHTYRGLFRCGLCNGPMSPELQKGHVYYRCQIPECETKTIREEALEHAIQLTLSRARFNDQNIEWITEQILAFQNSLEQSEGANIIHMQKANVENRLERLTDALIDGLIDKEAHEQRKQSLLLERADLCDKEEQLKSLRHHAHNVHKFLELAKTLVANYMFAIPKEKRQIVGLATSNRKVIRKNVIIEPANWLLAIENMLGVPWGGLDGPTSRRRSELLNQQLEALIKASRKANELVERQKQNADSDQL